MSNYIIYTEPPAPCTSALRVAGCCIIAEERVLLIQRGPLRTFAGDYEIPGGKIEKGETPQEAAVREVYEETGIRVDQLIVPVGVLYTAPVENPLQIDYEFFVFKALLPERLPVYLEPGHTDFQWIVPREIDKLKVIIGTAEVLRVCKLDLCDSLAENTVKRDGSCLRA